MKKIIVTLTSWEKRINNVQNVIKCMLNQTMKPLHIELNLSIVEFTNKEKSLPDELIKLIQDNETISINWCNGNDRSFKKVIPTLKKYYGEEYYLLSVDDDYTYRDDYIEIMVNNLENSNSDCFCLSKNKVIGNRIIYKSSCFENDFWEKLTQDVIDTSIDDEYTLHYLTSKNKKMSNDRPVNVQEIITPYNEVYPLHDEYKLPGRINKAITLINKINFTL